MEVLQEQPLPTRLHHLGHLPWDTGEARRNISFHVHVCSGAYTHMHIRRYARGGPMDVRNPHPGAPPFS